MVESLVAFEAFIVAVPHSLALTRNCEYASVVAPLAAPNLNGLLLLVVIHELGRPHLDHHQVLVRKLLVFNFDGASYHDLHRVSRELDAIFIPIHVVVRKLDFFKTIV